MQEEHKPADAFIRVGVEGGGCSGLTYKLEFSKTKSSQTIRFWKNKGMKIVCDKKSFLYLIGTEWKYTDGLNGKGFQFNNPNASHLHAVVVRVFLFDFFCLKFNFRSILNKDVRGFKNIG